jgi:2-oxoisovalerate dehydrogenase E2 component (dihydrolipoyl transacylase)
MSIFKLPDLGEGLPDAELVEWHVQEGDKVVADQPLCSVETAKAVVEVPSPQSGVVKKLHGKSGDIVKVGEPLVEFEGEGAAPREDKGAVVGDVEVGKGVVEETTEAGGRAKIGVKATPAVRALAKKLEVDLSVVTPSGSDGLITAADVQRVAKVLKEVGPAEPLRGTRRTMARNMSQAHAEVAPVSIMDDADIHEWPAKTDITIRLVRAMVAGAKTEPSLNAWYDSHSVARRVLEKIHVGIAVDTEDGLFVPVLRDVGNRDAGDLRQGLERMKADVKARSIPPEEMRGYTITLSNFGTFAGRYANPIVQPPTVAILGAGKSREQVVARDGKPVVRRILPLSLTFDHRACTGGEAARFLAAVIQDLEKPE